MPSRRPVKPRPSVVVALTETRASSMARISAMRRRMAWRWGAILGRFAQDGDVDIADAAALRAHEPQGLAQEEVRGRTLPAWIGIGKVLADVAGADGPEQRIGQRVQRHVGVGVTFQRVGVGELHPAQPEVVAGCEAVDVEALPRAHVRGDAGPLGHGQVLRGGELAVRLGAHDQRHRQSGPLGDGGIVGHLDAGRCGGGVGGEDLGKAEALRGLRAPDLGAIQRCGNALVGPGSLQRIGQWKGGDGAGRVGKSIQHAVDDFARDERPDGIVDEHSVGGMRCQRLEAVVHGGLPRRPAVERGEEPVPTQPLYSGSVVVGIACADHDLDEIDAGVLQEHAERAGQHGACRRSERIAWAAWRRPACHGHRQRSVRRFSIARPFASSMNGFGLSRPAEVNNSQQSPVLAAFALANSLAPR